MCVVYNIKRAVNCFKIKRHMAIHHGHS